MSIDQIHNRRLYPILHSSANHHPTSFAEQAQSALRDLYHDAHEDGKTKTNCLMQRIEAAKEALGFIFNKTAHKEKVPVSDTIVARLQELYNLAFNDAINGTKYGWAPATMARFDIAKIIDADGFRYSADELRQRIADNQLGYY